jgi:vanillate O-demethylase ferredoxin subunit
MSKIRARLLSKKQEAADIASFELAREDGSRLPPFSAGSHIDVHVPGGIVRQYSLCNDATEQHRYRIAVLRDPASRGGSTAMHDAIKVGDIIEISEPRNHFPLVHARRTILLAGGIGVTPLLCMAQRLAAIASEFEMHYCTRSLNRTAFRDEILQSSFAARVQFHFDEGATSQKLDLPRSIGKPDPGTHIYVCGPTGFINFVVDGAKAVGYDSDHIHLEYFGAAPHDTSGDGSFEVKIASTGKVYTIPRDKTVSQALQEHGIEILTSCEQGVCGTCITRVLDGECDHRDLYFTDEEKAKNDQFTPCCSRAKGRRLVLDL